MNIFYQIHLVQTSLHTALLQMIKSLPLNIRPFGFFGVFIRDLIFKKQNFNGDVRK